MKKIIILLSALCLLSCSTSKTKNKNELATIELKEVRQLTLEKPLDAGRKAHVGAASGLIKIGDRYFVAADDEAYIFSFSIDDKFLKPIRLVDLKLPADNVKRKAIKPDIESIAFITETDWPPHGAIVAWPSASTATRTKTYVLPLDKNGNPGTPVVSNMLPLAYQLQGLTKELNIEGILIRDKKVFLFQRGNSKDGKNGIAEIPLDDFIKGVKKNDWVKSKVKFDSVKMGKLSGVNVGFSDVIWTKYGLLALGSAEDTQSAYADGQVYGSVLARIVGDKAEIIGKFSPVSKLEGIYASETADGLDLFLVDDADDPAKPAKLYKAHVSGL